MGKLLSKLDLIPGAKSIIVVISAVGLWVGSWLNYVTEADFDKALQLLAIIFGGTMAMKVDRFAKAIGEVFTADEVTGEPAPPLPVTVVNPNTGSILGVLAVLLFVSVTGCAFVRFDGAGAQRVAVDALGRAPLPGAAVTAEDCDPIGLFQDRMLDEGGNERVTRWLWDKKDDSEPRQIVKLAEVQRTGCNILRERGSDGQVADRMRATLTSFWTNTGLKVGPADPE